MIPEAYDYKQTKTGFQPIYRCPICKADFSHFKDKERYCHNCGAKLEWENTIRGLKASVVKEVKVMEDLPYFVTKYNAVPVSQRKDYALYPHVKKLY